MNAVLGPALPYLLGTALIGLPILLIADVASAAVLGVAVAGIGIGAMFPLTSALHVEASALSSDGALGEVLSVAASGLYRHHRSR